MPPTKRELDAYLARAQKQGAPSIDSALLKSAAVQAEALTGRPEWDRYLHLLQAKLDEAKTAAAGWLERCGMAVSDTDVRVAQFNYQACKARVTTLEEAMQLPGTIIKEHQERRDA